MINFLLDKKSFYKVILSLLPLVPICSTLKDGLIIGSAFCITLIISALTAPLLYKHLSSKTAFSAKILVTSALSGLLYIVLNLLLSAKAETLGVYMPLVAVCTLIASINDKPSTFKTYFSSQCFVALASFLVVVFSSLLREFLGMGSVFGFDIFSKWFQPISFFSTSAGALFTVAVFVIVYQAAICRVSKGEEGKE